MKRVGTTLGAALLGSSPAGPLFVTVLTAEMLYATLPDPLVIEAGGIVFFVIALFVSLIPGFLLAFVPNLLGAALMGRAGEVSETARTPLAWVAAGTGAGTMLAALFTGFSDGAPAAVALIVTSAGCARLCRSQIDWEDQA
jgi:hypothetical protein